MRRDYWTGRERRKNLLLCLGIATCPLWLPPCLLYDKLYGSNGDPGSRTGISRYRPDRRRFESRRRSLSRTNHTSEKGFGQAQSRLFALPPEIRTLIFEYVVAHLTIPLEVARNPGEARPHLQTVASPTNRFPPPSGALLKPELQALRPTSLLHTCRRAYTEVKPMLYSTMTLVSDDPAIAIFLTAACPPSHFQGMRIQLHWFGIDPPDRSRRIGAYGRQKRHWREVWKAIAKLQGARVTVAFTDTPNCDWGRWWMHGEEAFGVIDEVGRGEFEILEVLVDWPMRSPPNPPHPWSTGSSRAIVQRRGEWKRGL